GSYRQDAPGLRWSGRNGLRTNAGRFSSCLQLSVDETVDAVNATRSAERDQFDLLCISRFEPDGRSCGDIQPHSVSRTAIEVQSSVHFKEMAMRTDLNRPVAPVRHDDASCRPAEVGLNRFFPEKVFSWNHFLRRMG